jgi:hypothetical protein
MQFANYTGLEDVWRLAFGVWRSAFLGPSPHPVGMSSCSSVSVGAASLSNPDERELIPRVGRLRQRRFGERPLKGDEHKLCCTNLYE